MEKPPDQNPLWWVFLAEDKRDFLLRVDQVTLSHKVIDRTARFAATRQTSLRHLVGTRESHPVVLTDADWEKMLETKKTGRLLSALKDNNRGIFHAFWFELETDSDETPPWWLLWFDLRDRETHLNHWKATGLPHAHIISYLTHPRDKMETYIDGLAQDPKYKLPHSAHVRFEDDGWQDFRWGIGAPKVTP